MEAVGPHPIVLIDTATAATMAQVLPVLLLTLTVELRRTRRLRGWSRWLVGAFLLAFGTLETIFVLSIDGHVYPWHKADLIAALTIFSLLAVIFWLSFVEPTDSSEDEL
jgi:hypothetical protein